MNTWIWIQSITILLLVVMVVVGALVAAGLAILRGFGPAGLASVVAAVSGAFFWWRGTLLRAKVKDMMIKTNALLATIQAYKGTYYRMGQDVEVQDGITGKWMPGRVIAVENPESTSRWYGEAGVRHPVKEEA